MGFNGEMFQLLNFMHSELNEGLQFHQTEMDVVCREENIREFLFDTGIFYTIFLWRLAFIYIILWPSAAIMKPLPLLFSASAFHSYLLREDFFFFSWAAAEAMQASYKRRGWEALCRYIHAFVPSIPCPNVSQCISS